MLRIYSVSLEMLRDIRPIAERIGQFDKDHARQLRKSASSVVLNIAEGSAVRDGRRRSRYGDALGSAEETRANLEVAACVGYIALIPPQLGARLRQIIGTLVRLTR